jgi:hypothetical protein
MTKLATVASLAASVRRAVPQLPPGGGTPPPPSGGGGEVLLTNKAGPATLNVPVRTGIPFAIGQLFDLEKLQLVDPTTDIQRDAQFDPLTTWEDGSYKHVLTQFLADVGASDTTHKLKFGTGVSRTAPAQAVTVVQNSGVTTVSHPAGITVVINAQGGITSVSRGGQQIIYDGVVVPVEAAVAAREFSTAFATDTVSVVEESGPVTACIRFRGTFRNASNQAYHQYVLRWFISRDSFDADVTVVDETSTANENSGIPLTFTMALRKFAFRCKYTVDGTAQYRFGLESNGMDAGNVTGEHYLAQTGSWPYQRGISRPAPGHTFSYSGVGTGQFAPGFVNIQGSTGTRRFCVFLKDMWKAYPGELNINNDTLEVQFFSRRGVSTWDVSAPSVQPVGSFDGSNMLLEYNSLYNRSSGGAYTYRMRMSFHPTARTDAELHQENTLFQRNTLECRAPLTWYHASKAHGDLMTINADATTGQLAWFKQSNVAPQYAMLPTQGGGDSGASTASGNMTLHGKRNYGDRARSDSDAPYMQQDTHIGSWKEFQAFLMTGEEMFWEMAFMATQHYYDVDIRHNPCIPYGNYGAPGVNAPAGGTRFAGHAAFDHDGDHDFSEHYHVSGMQELYMLTGDRRALDVLKETSNWIEYITRYTHKLPFVLQDKYRESDRYFGYPILGMVQANRGLCDRAYHVKIADRVKYMDQWNGTDGPHFGWNPAANSGAGGFVWATSSPSPYEWPLGTPIGMNRRSEGTGMWGCQRADNSYGGISTGTSPWFSMPTMEAIWQFIEAERRWVAAGYAATIDEDETIMTLYQQMKYLLLYCYDDAAMAGAGAFVYAEGGRPANSFNTPGDSDGSVHNTLGIRVMLEIDKQYKADVIAGRPRANTAWFGPTLGTKLPLLCQKYTTMMWNTSATTNRKTESAYGYQFPFNPFWKLSIDQGYRAP